MNLKEIEKQLYTDKYLDEKKYYIYASIINEIGGFHRKCQRISITEYI